MRLFGDAEIIRRAEARRRPVQGIAAPHAPAAAAWVHHDSEFFRVFRDRQFAVLLGAGTVRAHHLGGEIDLSFDRHFGKRLPGAAQHPFFLGGAQHGVDLSLAEARGDLAQHVPHPVAIEIVQRFKLVMRRAGEILGFVKAAGVDCFLGQQMAWLAQGVGIVGAQEAAGKIA